eukprot:CAMPEP_0168594556 /NCGR_PEP_ID=MMETSP0420-20121227/8966_1 /TAXON_ID=498008 /ORGANISM="Pessonella sp." /LENGTH=180 /DNA_ID=CAMNT_0008630893 /DNA_START=1508 /DNA_END=2050 /DNA_ORIENTATION=-
MGWFTTYYNNLSQAEIHQFMAWFAAIDKDRSGTIDAREITSIQFGGKNVTINTASVLLKSFDNDRSGNITFWEYVALHKFIMHVQQAFMATDRDKSYTIDFNEIQSALHMVGFPNLNPALIQTLMAKFSMGNGHMTFEGFLAMSAHLALIRSLFDWNSKGTGVASFDFAALAVLCTTMLP